jgi:Ca2+-transporting ATPase
MTTLHQTPDGVLAITKGAMDILLQKLATGAEQTEPERLVNEMAGKGYRVLGYACRMLPSLPSPLDATAIETDLLLIGFAGMIDPPREEAKHAIAQCRKAGIIPVMITGDHILTAKAIAKTLGIITAEDEMAMTGTELAEMSKPDYEKIAEKVRVYARVSPEQKLNIIQALQAHGHIVAMTGDGVNDAPALKNADIGIAMGINGTEVSREAAHMILLDDNYATIVVAIRHGRRIFDNILKFIKFIMTGNSGEIWTILLAPFLGLPIPLLAIQILWINLVSDGLPALALASEPAEANIMARKPRHTTDSIFAGGMGIHILWVGLLIAAVTLGVQAWALHTGNPHWQTMALNVLCISQMGHIMAIRSGRQSVFSVGLFSNKPMIGALLLTFGLQLAIIYVPFLNTVFKTQPLTLTEISITIAASSIVFWAVELEKFIKRRLGRRS